MSKKWFLSLLLAGFVSVGAACGDADESAENNNDSSELQEEQASGESEAAPVAGDGHPEMPEPDLEGIPNVVAEVNGKEILREEFEQAYVGQLTQVAMQSKMYGEEVNQDQLKEQIVDSMVGQELLIQEADRAGYNASEKDIDETLDGLLAQYGLDSKEEFMVALEEQGMDKDEVMSQLQTQVKVDKLLASESGDIEPTDKELEELYDQIKAQQEQMGGEEAEVPSFAEIKSDLVEHVKKQKTAEAAQALIEKLRAGADITIHL
ncbi:SurA N-terminal domain-containing protein [Alkalihalobacillus sp. BA299]|uniref:SurA N-terminal domain-containing protein n=1 Tax=Alkalihalobacillus sp. BA299 TaxID=2815938 RepID=UPI001ADD02EB|nr:SurA N-terminal domain-containing protein [Alkalihalobacillus sp. BA299]